VITNNQQAILSFAVIFIQRILIRAFGLAVFCFLGSIKIGKNQDNSNKPSRVRVAIHGVLMSVTRRPDGVRACVLDMRNLQHNFSSIKTSSSHDMSHTLIHDARACYLDEHETSGPFFFVVVRRCRKRRLLTSLIPTSRCLVPSSRRMSKEVCLFCVFVEIEAKKRSTL